MARGSAVNGILGMLGGVLLALLAIFVGRCSVQSAGEHEAPSAQHP